MLHLLPLSRSELPRTRLRPDLFGALFTGGYPRLHARGVEPTEWLSSYTATYVERDVRQVLRVGDLTAFQTFLRLCAGRSGQLLNLAGLAGDAGISHGTARAWLSVLEAGFIVFRLPPLHRNLGKRLVKAPKLHFYDSGLLCYLLGIRGSDELRTHPLRGSIFETWVISEIMKARLHHGLPADLFFYRDRKGNEVDAFLESATRPMAVEIKSGETVSSDFLRPLDSLAAAMTAASEPCEIDQIVVYGGAMSQVRAGTRIVPWSALDRVEWVVSRPTKRSGRAKQARAPKRRARR